MFLLFIYLYLKDNNDINIIFLNAEQSSKFLLKDNDKYIETFNIQDLYARKVNTKDEYKDLISKSTYNFNDKQKEKIKIVCKEASKYLNIINIKWIFALTNNNYENGFPHTRENIIFLSTSVLNNDIHRLTSIIIHEYTHIYQRYNKDIIDNQISNMGFTKSRKRFNIPRIRSNPDLDDYIYKDKNGIELICLYSNDTPSSINDVILSNIAYEHPYELMAYNIENKYNKSLLYKYKNI